MESIDEVIQRQEREKKDVQDRIRRIANYQPKKKKRTDWKGLYLKERKKVLQEAKAEINWHVGRMKIRPHRGTPEGRAFTLALQSAMTTLEMMMEDKK